MLISSSNLIWSAVGSVLVISNGWSSQKWQVLARAKALIGEFTYEQEFGLSSADHTRPIPRSKSSQRLHSVLVEGATRAILRIALLLCIPLGDVGHGMIAYIIVFIVTTSIKSKGNIASAHNDLFHGQFDGSTCAKHVSSAPGYSPRHLPNTGVVAAGMGHRRHDKRLGCGSHSGNVC